MNKEPSANFLSPMSILGSKSNTKTKPRFTVPKTKVPEHKADEAQIVKNESEDEDITIT